jgi:glycosyltransferase involved in cell wall biosynthesis
MNSTIHSSHCIVTPDFIGPIKNGGIGTACYELASFLSGDLGAKVTILFTGPMINNDARHWKAHYASTKGWSFVWLDDESPQKGGLSFYNNTPWFVERARRIDVWLRDRVFDQIHFQEWQANGFCAAQAKEQGIAHLQTFITCTVHSPHQWINEGARAFPTKGIEDLLQHYCERYSACKADLTVFPSRHMLEWAQSKKWTPQSFCIAPYVYQTTASQSQRRDDVRPIEELCFFGRLESRKGLELYLSALEVVINTKGTRFLPRLSFLGKVGVVNGMNAKDYLEEFARKHDLKINVLTSFDAASAIAYLGSDAGRVAVTPSLVDNLPYTVIECVEKNIPILASAVGGIPEIIASKQHLFEPRLASLVTKIVDSIERGVGPAKRAYSSESARTAWTEITRKSSQRQKSRIVEGTDITICIAYYNYGQYLPELLSSLATQSVQGFKVVVVNDGSTDRESNEVFGRMRDQFSMRDGWFFTHQENSGIGATRNVAASLAETKYIVFMDADNVAKPEMVEKMAQSMSYTEADCLTCYMEGFKDGDCSTAGAPVYEFLPTGGCVEAGLFMNVCGDANFIVKKHVFNALGGFTVDRTASFEDWEFLARLMLGGFRLDVIPEILFRYRHTEQGFSRSTSAYLNHRRVVNAYAAHLPDWGGGVIESAYKLMVPRCDDYSQSTFLARMVLTARRKFHKLPPVARSLAAKCYRRLRSVMAG